MNIRPCPVVSVRAVLALAALAVMLAGSAEAQSPAGAFLDHFKCYRANHVGASGTMSLVDQYVSTNSAIRKPNRFCNPVDKNGEGINDPTGHLMCHKIKDAVRFTKRDALVRNQFGDQHVRVIKAEAICNPAEKDGVPLSSAVGAFLDHFKCYRARSTTPVPQTVTLADQFTTVSSRVFKLQILCNPVDKNGSGIKQPLAHLACYKIRDANKFIGQTVTVTDQFATYVLKARSGGCHKPQLLCLPSEKDPTSTTTTVTTSTSTTTVTLPQTLCCDVPPGALGNPVPVCLDAVPPDVVIKCSLLGGTLFPVGFLCDPNLEQCVPGPPIPPSNFCCECPVPAPPFPHPTVCFEGITTHEFKCQPPCVLHPTLTCGPNSEQCGGSPSGAFLDATTL